MFVGEFTAAAGAARAKAALLAKNPLGYFLSSMLAGVYVGLGILLIYSIGGQLAGQPYVKAVMGVSFGVSLSLVTVAGSELFTGNNLVMAAGLSAKTVTIGETARLWVTCYIGNWFGALLVSALFFGAGLAAGPTAAFIAEAAAAKMSVPFLPLLLRGMLCNALVCLAVWSGYRLSSESGKLVMIFWCLFAFITTGYEHSIANMTLLTVALLAPAGAAVGAGGYFYNILVVTLGNMLGGVLLIALPYSVIARRGNRR